MSSLSSSKKQTRLDFSVSRRTVSNSQKGNVGKSLSKPTEAPKVIPSPAKSNAGETDESIHEDAILVGSDTDSDAVDSEHSMDDDELHSPTKEDTIIPSSNTGRELRSSTKKATQKLSPAKQQENTTTGVSKSRVSHTKNTTTPSQDATTAKVAPTIEKVETAKPSSELKINNPKWSKHYIEVREKMGNMPPIHGESENKIHEILRVFDNSYEYGPCVGVSRLDRWKRAKVLGLNPPVEIEEILTTKQGTTMPEYSQTVFYGEV